MKVSNQLTAALISAAAILGLSSASQAQGYPNKQVTIVMPFAAGSPTDALARVIAPQLQARLGQTVIIENKPGATGMIGTAFVAKAPADGYTLLFGTNTTQVANKYFFKTVPYDGEKDFSPVVVVGGVPHALVVHPSLNVNSVPELIEYARKNPGKINYPYANSTTRITGATLRNMTKTDMLDVAYKAYPQAVTDLLSGVNQMMFLDFTTGLGHMKSGRLKALAITPDRSDKLPGVPAMREVVPGFNIGNWNGLFAPAGTPKDIITRLNNDFVEILKMPEVQKQIDGVGYELIKQMSPDDFAKFISAESKEWAELVKNAGIEPE